MTASSLNYFYIDLYLYSDLYFMIFMFFQLINHLDFLKVNGSGPKRLSQPTGNQRSWTGQSLENKTISVSYVK